MTRPHVEPGVAGVAELAEQTPAQRGHRAVGERLDDGELAAVLAEAGLAVDAYLTGDGSWVRAVPAFRGEALGRSPRSALKKPFDGRPATIERP